MKIVCDACSAKYSIADDKVRGKAVKIKCKKCNNVIFVKGDEVAAGVDEAKDTRVFGYNDAPAGEEAVWHVVIDQEQVGPITATELKQRIADGQVDAESYVWREGFDDWQPVSAVAQFAGVASAGQTVRSDLASMPAVARAADDVATDLFGARGAGAGAAAAPAAAVSQDDKRMRGERNENSVLFSLSSLAALTSDAPRSAAAASPGGATAGRAQVGGNEGSGLIDIRSMAGAYLGERAPARNTGRVGSMDDIPVFSGAAFAEPAVILPPSSRASNNNKVLYGLIGAVGLLAIAAIVMAVFVFKKDEGNQTVAVAAPTEAKPVAGERPAGTPDPAENPAQPGGAPEVAAPAPTTPTPTPAVPESSGDKTSAKGDTKTAKSSSSDKASKPTERDRTPTAPVVDAAKPATEPKADAKGCSEVDCLLAEKPPACCSKYGKAGGGAAKTSAAASGLDESLDTSAIKSGLAKVNARAKSCSTKSSAKGKVKVRVRANGSGTVDSTSVLESPDDALGSCVAAALQKATFKATQNGATFTVPFTF